MPDHIHEFAKTIPTNSPTLSYSS
ncbi:hypothetical protein [Candidatus Methylacidiphilum fumarolicum]